jgi:glycerol-3-phosphate acyltransferase PlsY
VLILAILITFVAGYMIGSLPTGFLWGRARGIDIRKEGSGNIGATNVFRVLGKTQGICVLIFDTLKGVCGATLAPTLGMMVGSGEAAGGPELIYLVGGLAAVIGHNYTCWLGFKGGKGIATSAGVLIALLPWAFVVSFSTWIVVTVVTRYVSMASIAAAAVLPIAAIGLGRSGLMIGLATTMGVLAIYKHRANINRLIQKSEPRIEFGKKKKLGS